MQKVGDDSAGFSVDFPLTGGTLVMGWGFWSSDVAKAFASTVIEACRRQRRGPALMLDLRELKPMRDEGQRTFSDLLRSLPTLGIAQTSIVTTNPLTKLQLVRLVKESGVDGIDWIYAADNQKRDG
jgi:hypothetical protein